MSRDLSHVIPNKRDEDLMKLCTTQISTEMPRSDTKLRARFLNGEVEASGL